MAQSNDPNDDDDGVLVKLLMTGIILVLMLPGLIIEPGPLSEIVGLGAIGAVWGLDLSPDEEGNNG